MHTQKSLLLNNRNIYNQEKKKFSGIKNLVGLKKLIIDRKNSLIIHKMMNGQVVVSLLLSKFFKEKVT
jgi:hypothetical protein